MSWAPENSKRQHVVILSLRDVIRLVAWGTGLPALVIAAVLLHFNGALHGVPSADDVRDIQHVSWPRVLGGAGTEDCGSHADSQMSHSLEGTLCFLVVCCLACCALDQCNMVAPTTLRLPISVVLFITGMLVGVVCLKTLDSDTMQNKGFDTFIEGMQGASYLDPHALFYVLLPPLLYESASSMSWRVLRKVFSSCMLLALPGVFLNTLLVGCLSRAVVHVGDFSMSWAASFLLASILSATDPVAVVASLQALGAPAKLASLIEGESLLNDGSAVVFFFVFLDMVATDAPDSMKQCPGMPPSGSCVALYFFRLAAGGPALGVAIGAVVFSWIGSLHENHPTVLEIAIVLTSVYGTFFLAECLHVSGVLAVVALGINATANVRARMSHDGRHAHHVVLAQVGYVCNQIIFFAAGIISARFMWTSCQKLYKSPTAWLELAFLYVCIHVTRSLVVAFFSPLLTRQGYGVKWKEAAVLVWGGLRGAVGLAMGLIVEHHPHVDAEISATIAFHVSGIVLLTLLINGTTVDTVYNRLQLYPPNPFRMTYLRNVLRAVEAKCAKAIVERMHQDWFFEDIDFESILCCVPDLSQVKFDAAGVPHPDGIKSVVDTLKSLELGINDFNIALVRAQTNYANMQGASWMERKEAKYGTCLDTLMKPAEPTRSRKDQLIKVSNSGDQRLEFRSSDSSAGLYVSARPLSALSAGSEWLNHFSVIVVAKSDVTFIVGLIGNESCPQGIEKQEVHLGRTQNSVGLNCSSGQMKYTGPKGEGDIWLGEDCGDVGETVEITMTYIGATGWKVTFSRYRTNGEHVELGSCSLGDLSPDNMYPAIQFYPSNSFWNRKQGSAMLLVESPLENKEYFGCERAASQPKLWRVRSLSLLSISSLWRREERIERKQDALRTLSVDPTVSRSVVQLSYEPQTASEEESLEQIFHVILNMVAHQYREMHEHGLIGNDALAWLTEGVGEATDCSNRELHHTQASDFSHIYRMARSPSSRGTLRRILEEDMMQETRLSAKGTFLGVFEPLVVEYLALEQHWAGETFLDHLSNRWSLTRRLGYGRTLAKMESLWAYVEAHTLVLREYPALEQHPNLKECLEALISEVKNDLKLLQEMRPRRFCYGKHFLALRVVMTKKHETLKKYTKEGWISKEDSIGFSDALWRRVVQVARFIPSLQRTSSGGRRNSCLPPEPERQVSGSSASLSSSLTSVVPDESASVSESQDSEARKDTPSSTGQAVAPSGTCLRSMTPNNSEKRTMTPNTRERLEAVLRLDLSLANCEEPWRAGSFDNMETVSLPANVLSSLPGAPDSPRGSPRGAADSPRSNGSPSAWSESGADPNKPTLLSKRAARRKVPPQLDCVPT